MQEHNLNIMCKIRHKPSKFMVIHIRWLYVEEIYKNI